MPCPYCLPFSPFTDDFLLYPLSCLVLVFLWRILICVHRRSMGTRGGRESGQVVGRDGDGFGDIACRLTRLLLRLHCRTFCLLRMVTCAIPLESVSCGWRRTLVRVASGVVCVDFCVKLLFLLALSTELSICSPVHAEGHLGSFSAAPWSIQHRPYMR